MTQRDPPLFIRVTFWTIVCCLGFSIPVIILTSCGKEHSPKSQYRVTHFVGPGDVRVYFTHRYRDDDSGSVIFEDQDGRERQIFGTIDVEAASPPGGPP